MPEIEFAASARQADAIERSGALAVSEALADRIAAGLAARAGAEPGPRRPLPDGRDVAPGCAAIVRLAAGARLTVAQVEGGTCVDVVAWGPEPGERLSPAHSRAVCGANPTVGAVLVSAPPYERPLLRVTADTAPGHDLLFPACSPGEFATVGCAPEPSCRALHDAVGAACGEDLAAVPDPLNLWFRSWTGPDGDLAWASTPSAAGDLVELEALADCRVGVNPCVSDVFGCSPFGAGSIRVAAGTADVDVLGTPLPAPSVAVRVDLPAALAGALADRAPLLGTTADALCRALVLEAALADLGDDQAGGR